MHCNGDVASEGEPEARLKRGREHHSIQFLPALWSCHPLCTTATEADIPLPANLPPSDAFPET